MLLLLLVSPHLVFFGKRAILAWDAREIACAFAFAKGMAAASQKFGMRESPRVCVFV